MEPEFIVAELLIKLLLSIFKIAFEVDEGSFSIYATELEKLVKIPEIVAF